MNDIKLYRLRTLIEALKLIDIETTGGQIMILKAVVTNLIQELIASELDYS